MKKLLFTLLFFPLCSSTIAQSYLDLYDIYAVSPEIVWTIGQDKCIYNTTDGGNTWHTQFTSLQTLTSISFYDFQSGIAVGVNGVIVSTTNGGAVWNNQSSGVNTSLNDICFIDPDIAFIVGDSGVILKTTDGGLNWSQKQSQTTVSLLDVKFRDNITGIIAGGIYFQQGIILKTDDGGETWSQVFNSNRKVVSVSCLNNGKWLVADYLTGIFRSSDNGTSWESIFPYSVVHLIYDMHFFDDLNGICVGAKRYTQPSWTSSHYWMTSDGGLSWSFIPFFGEYITSVSFAGQIGYCTTINDPYIFPGNTLFKSFNSGASWTSLYLPVELTSFNSVLSDGGVSLFWTTASEVNNRGFEIERRKEDFDFRTIGFVNGEGTTAEIQNYTFFDIPLENGKYYYRLNQLDLNGNSVYSDVLTVMYNIPGTFRLSQNYPNPFNPMTKIQYEIPKQSEVSVKMYDVLGRLVSVLVDDFKAPGVYEIEFNGSALPSGIYIYKLETPDFTSVEKMIIMK